ncbi:hypothetical protein [Streptomyces bobili]|uniref:hypothetical protein n=1 Tax=Streptomyces bobili TaxID=67280 RepID=UPI003F53F9E7
MVAAVEAGGHLDAFVALVVLVVAVVGALRYGGVRLARGSGPEVLREVLESGPSRPGRPRRSVSSSSTLLTKSLFPRALSGLTDPMSGFFAIRRTAVDRASAEDEGLQPLGYKILLELAVRCRPRGIAEVPYAFGERHAGAFAVRRVRPFHDACTRHVS